MKFIENLCNHKNTIEFTYYADDDSSESYTSYLPINNNPLSHLESEFDAITNNIYELNTTNNIIGTMYIKAFRSQHSNGKYYANEDITFFFNDINASITCSINFIVEQNGIGLFIPGVILECPITYCFGHSFTRKKGIVQILPFDDQLNKRNVKIIFDN